MSKGKAKRGETRKIDEREGMKGKGCKLRIDDTYEHTRDKQGLVRLTKRKEVKGKE